MLVSLVVEGDMVVIDGCCKERLGAGSLGFDGVLRVVDVDVEVRRGLRGDVCSR